MTTKLYELRDGDTILRQQYFTNPPGEGWYEIGGTPVPTTREEKKAARETAVEAIVVEVNGKQFDGDEVSQTRMARALVAMNAAGIIEVPWTLATNETALVSTLELTTALLMAGRRQTELWAI
jgi:hypothetical protein